MTRHWGGRRRVSALEHALYISVIFTGTVLVLGGAVLLVAWALVALAGGA